jgi:hypothetical protein
VSFLQGLLGLGAVGLGASMSKSAAQRRTDALAREDDILSEKLRDLIWHEKPDAYFDWTEKQQDAFDADIEAQKNVIKARRDAIDDELIELDWAMRR